MVSKQELLDILQENDAITGTTTDDYVNGLDWECGILISKSIFLKNTDITNSLDYKVLTYAYKDDIEYEEVAETALAAGDMAQINLSFAYAQIKIPVKSSVAGFPATYSINYIGIN